MATGEPFPYNLPVFRRAFSLASPDGSMLAAIERAEEVSMSNPTMGTLTVSTGLSLDRCNPSFVWSDDSRYIAVPRFFTRLGVFRRQRMIVIDTRERRVFESRETAWYFQPESFAAGLLTVVAEPFRSATILRWHIPGDLVTFRVVKVVW